MNLFTPPKFSAKTVAHAIGKELGRELVFQEAEDDEGTDGNVDVSIRVYVQVGDDYIIVGAWVDEHSMRSWPPRATITAVLKDVREALAAFPEVAA